MEEARKRSGLGAVFLKRLLGHLNQVPDAASLKRTDVHVDELREAMVYWKKLINLKDAAAELSILPEQVKSLQNCGVLQTVKITSSLRYSLRGEVQQLLTNIHLLPEELSEKSVAPLKEYCRERGIPLTQVIKLWCLGELDGKICRGAGSGLHALEMDWEAQTVRCEMQLDRDLELPQAAKYLKIGIRSIRQLRDGGYLTEVRRRNPDTNHLKSYISYESIRQFEGSYVTLGQLAQARNQTAMHLALQFDRAGVLPVATPLGLVRAYPRDAL